MKYPSRNRRATHEDYYICSQCKDRVYYEDLSEDMIEHFSENTIICECPNCGATDVPNVTIDIHYKYSNSKDKNFKQGK